MQFNSAGPIRGLTAREQDGLLKMLFPAKQLEVFTKNRTIDSRHGFLDLFPRARPRELTQDEKNVAGGFFGDMINLEKVRIDDKSWLALILASNNLVMTLDNTIYGINIPNDTLIHELVHVWQYNRGADFETVGKAHIKALQADETAESYGYSVADIGDENRTTFREYEFEEQASILQDAYLVTVERQPPSRNKDYKGEPVLPKGAKLLAQYCLFMGEFRQWHQEPPETE